MTLSLTDAAPAYDATHWQQRMKWLNMGYEMAVIGMMERINELAAEGPIDGQQLMEELEQKFIQR